MSHFNFRAKNIIFRRLITDFVIFLIFAMKIDKIYFLYSITDFGRENSYTYYLLVLFTILKLDESFSDF